MGDEIWVSGNIGDAALALAHIKGHLILPYYTLAMCEKALHTPQPRVALGIALREIANSAIDISDGLLADLGHILARSKVGAILQLQKLPLTNYADKVLFNNLPSQKSLLQLQLTGGDDYELCFTANIEKHAEILQLGYDMALPLSCIGLITPGNDVVLHGDNNEILKFEESGFDHFSQAN